MECILIIVAIVVQVLFSAVIIHVCAMMLGLGDRGFGTAISCAIALIIVGVIIGVAAALMTCISPVLTCLGLLVGWLFVIYIIQSAYDTSWGNAFLIWLLSVLVSVVLSLILPGPSIFDIMKEQPDAALQYSSMLIR